MFKTIKLKTRMLLGFGAILIVMAVISGLGYFEFSKIGHKMDLYSETVDEASGVAMV